MENNKEIEEAIRISESIQKAESFKQDVESWVWNELETLYNTKTFGEEQTNMVKCVIDFTMVGLAKVGLNENNGEKETYKFKIGQKVKVRESVHSIHSGQIGKIKSDKFGLVVEFDEEKDSCKEHGFDESELVEVV